MPPSIHVRKSCFEHAHNFGRPRIEGGRQKEHGMWRYKDGDSYIRPLPARCEDGELGIRPGRTRHIPGIDRPARFSADS